MLRQGIHPKIVQERLGHSRVGVTLDIYSHVTPGLQEAAALRFDEGLNGQPSDQRETAERNGAGLLQKLLQPYFSNGLI